MKKCLILILSIVFVFCFAACSDNKTRTNQDFTDVKYYADLGQINGVDCKLGESADSAKQKLDAADQASADAEEQFVYDYQAGGYTVLTNGTVCCCYKTDGDDSKITHIVKFGDAYGFKQGAVSIEVRDTMNQAGYTARERDAQSGELFFLPSGGSYTVLQYDFDKNSVLFVFEENALCATVVYAK